MPASMAPAHSSSMRGQASQAHGKSAEKVIAMDDYPRGRGGMNRIGMPQAGQAAPVVDRPGMIPIGPQPPATRMP
jgi:hypothetical protein